MFKPSQKQTIEALEKVQNGIECNDPEVLALLKAGEQIKNSAFNSTSADPNFKARLKAQILAKRQAKTFSMKEKLVGLLEKIKPFLVPKRLAPVVAFVVLIAVVATTINFWPGSTGPNGKFARLMIDTAYAHDNFDITATDTDTLGVAQNTKFTITSKEAITDQKALTESIQLEPAADFTLKKINDHEFRLIPKKELANKKVYKIKIGSKYINEEGLEVNYDYSWAFQVQDHFKIVSTLPRNQSTGVPTNSGIEIAFSYEGFNNFENSFSITPATKGKFEKHGRVAVFVPEQLLPGTLYTVTVKPDVKVDNSNEKLTAGTTFQFETQATYSGNRNTDSNIWFNVDTAEFNTNMAPVIGLYSNNQTDEELPLTIYGFKSAGDYLQALKTRDNIPYWATAARGSAAFDYSKLPKVAEYNVKTQSYDYGKYLVLPNPLPAGYYLLIAKHDNQDLRVYLQISDVAVYSNYSSNNKILLWANDFKTKKAIAGAVIKDMETGKSITAGNDGVAVLEAPTLKPEDYVVKHYLVTSGNRSIITSVNLYGGYFTSANDKYWNYFYTDRFLYKPTDQINFWGVIKPRGDNTPVKKATVRVVGDGMYDYYYDPIAIMEQSIDINDQGVFSGKIDLKNIVPKSYTLQLLINDQVVTSRYINVQTYTKPAYKIDVVPDKDRIWAGETLTFKIKTAFFDGTPVSNIELVYNASNGENAKITTDEKGEATVQLATTYDKDNRRYYYGYSEGFELNVAPVKSEEGDISGAGYAEVFGPNMKFEETKVESVPGAQKARVSAKVLYVDINKPETGYSGGAVVGQQINVGINQISYVAEQTGTQYDFINKLTYKTYRYNRIVEPLPHTVMTTNENGVATTEFNTDPKKTYEIALTSSAQNNRVLISNLYYYATENTAIEENEGYEYYSLSAPTLHNNGYNLGESAEFYVNKNDRRLSDNAGGNFLFYQMKAGLQNYEVKNTPYTSFVFSGDKVPNISLGAVWFDGKTFKAVSSVTVRYNRENSKLNIKTTTDKPKYKPGENVKLDINITDKNNQPVSANVNIDLVDAAIVAMGKNVADPLAELFTDVNEGSISSDFTHRLPVIRGGAERGGCFLAGTKIKMADGTEKNIEKIKVGDKVLTFESPQKLELVPGEVAKTFAHTVRTYLVINKRLSVTAEHKILVSGVWRPIGEAKIGDVLIDEKGKPTTITSIETRQEFVRVYNFQVTPQHTYIANGIYVHNDKGEGSGRQFFPDIAVFRNVNTDAAGNASITFKLPDNITSWLITTQAISDNIEAGLNQTEIPVSLPLFTEPTIAGEYVEGDQPILKVRAYGDILKTGTPIKFFAESNSLNMKREDEAGKAFDAVYFTLPRLLPGDYKIRSGAEAQGKSDAVIKPIKVLSSRLGENEQKFYDLRDNPKIEGGKINPTTLIFTDKNRGRFLNDTYYLGWAYGNRVDQKLARILGYELLNKYFGTEYDQPEEFDGSKYQDQNGGITLLPYSSSELELSAKVAAVAADRFDRASLTGYFYGTLNNEGSNKDEIVRALYGLAGLNEPVLILVRDFAKVNDLSTNDKLFLALAAQQLGDQKLAREIYTRVVNDQGEELKPYARINASKNTDDVVSATTLTAILSGGLGESRSEMFWSYARENNTKDILTDLEKILYLQKTLPLIPAGPSKFFVTIDGKRTEKSLDNGESYRVVVSSDQLKTISTGVLEGNVGLTSVFEKSASEIKNNSNLVWVDKKYFTRSGLQTDTFQEGQFVEVRVYFNISQKSLGGEYEITDILPSGLQLATRMYGRDMGYACDIWYPYETNGQKVKFIVGKGWLGGCANNFFRYYARVVSPGKYVVEPIKIQSLKSATIKSFSTYSTINIDK